MGRFSTASSKNSSSKKTSSSTSTQQNTRPVTLQQDVQIRIPGCKVHLIDEGEAFELANGEFKIIKIFDDNVPLATIVKVGENLQWPLTKDEPVVKLDALHYLFSLPVKDGEPLSYGITFSQPSSAILGLLDSFLMEHSCFSGLASSKSVDIDWKEFAPKIENYNNFLARVIAGGTGQIIRGIFTCTNNYNNQVQKGIEMIMTSSSYPNEQNGTLTPQTHYKSSAGTEMTAVNKALRRARQMSEVTERISKSMLDGVGIATGSVMAPIVTSQAGKALLTTVPGQVLLASLDAVNKILDAAELAEKQALSVTSGTATRMVSRRFGENAGEATEDVLATVGHCANTAWNISKIRRAINPASTVPSGVLKNAGKSKSFKY